MADIIQRISRLADVDGPRIIKHVVHEISSNISQAGVQILDGKYTADLEILCRLVKNIKSDTKDQEDIVSEIDSLIWSVCIPMLRLFQSSMHISSGKNTHQILLVTCELLVTSLEKSTSDQVVQVLQHCTDALQSYCTDSPGIYGTTQHNDEYLGVSCTVELLRTYLNARRKEIFAPDVCHLLHKIFAQLICTFPLVSDKVFARVISGVLSPILRQEPTTTESKLAMLWRETQLLCQTVDCKKSQFEDKTLVMFCSLADFYFPISEETVEEDLRCSDSFWGIVQRGLYSVNPVSRKRSLYLLKRIVDTCESNNVDVNTDMTGRPYPIFQWKTGNRDLAVVWEHYILLVETLEEKQVHVIKPLLGRMQSLVKAATNSGAGWCLHTSWLMTVLSRCYQHESQFIIKWGVETALNLDLTAVPLLEQGQQGFLTGDFLLILQELRLFLRPPGVEVGTCPPVAVNLARFFSNCLTQLKSKDRQGDFLAAVCGTLMSCTWGSTPMLFLCRALANIPATPILTPRILTLIKDMLTTLMTTMEPLQKGAIQCFLLKAILRLTDKTQVTVEDFASILAVFERNESLQRGTTQWVEASVWLQEAATEADEQWSQAYIQQAVNNMIHDFLIDPAESGMFNSLMMTKIVRLLVIAMDAGIFKQIQREDSIGLDFMLGQITDVIRSINSHPYMTKVKADRAVSLLATLATEHSSASGGVCECDQSVQEAVEGCWQELVVYIGNRVTQDITEMDDLVLLDMYTGCMERCLKYLPPDMRCQSLFSLVTTCVSKLQHLQALPQVYLESQIQTVSLLCLLAAVSDIVDSFQPSDTMADITETILEFTVSMTMIPSFTKQASKTSNSESRISQKDWGRVVSRYISSQWQCMYFLLKRSPGRLSATQLLETCYDAFDVGTRDSDIQVLHCVQCLLSELVTVEPDTVCKMLHVAWVKASEELHTASYWRKLSCVVKLLTQSPLLLAGHGSQVNECLLKHMGLLFKLGEEKMGVANMLIEHLYPHLVSDDHGIQIANNFRSILADACMFGGMHHRTDRLILDVTYYIENQGKMLSVNDVMPRFSKGDGIVRVFAINFLSHLDPNEASHADFAQALTLDLCARHDALMELAEYRQFNNSLCHRQKNRIFQAICVLEPFIKEGDSLQALWQFVWKCLVNEAHASVRHMQEWVLMRLVLRFPDMVGRMWEHFNQFNDKRNLSLCSLMHVLSRCGPHLPKDLQNDFYGQALPLLLPWCMAHHFNTRVHAQASLTTLWNQCHKLNLNNLISHHSIINSIVTFQENNNNSTKNLQKLIGNYFYQTFDFVEDYSMETIFLTLPRLSCLIDEEWLRPDTFHRWDIFKSPDLQRCVPLYNASSRLRECVPGPWKIRPPVSDTDCADEEVTEGNVQKKIMPWRLMTPDEDSHPDNKMNLKKVHKAGGLILVTSLIDKLPNLGGLCRTSEIFGVSEFIIGNLCFIEDRAFQSLSVTAHKWIPITEVPGHRLQEFLQAKRRDGYTLVGAEQTANSVCLTQYKFPQKTLLLLGNEKEGIPVNLIQLLDVCVEIPQQGIIRSLNVHVSGALLVWEYARQQMDAATATL
ncbi:probable methyltransferase TARBP1 isoform X3 [Haliotis rufescens]|uniref:probable methyltransferase TARBP1 isoform X1 n=1 Tax=Haliotis rufescens TaxID=6454 RepID=UPI00201EFA67|nr:probable methyltransferase TARBP1 isoform X1 [Haliotis rufescens]XP_046337096.2 probable methyltransferase TARBP1 isoform X2 [Haliotis rufescens]XP_048258990.1 probable methyltransferase TARBP1 isoform X3 [Haliotis rufescens]